ncbi:hypothetical protein Tco_0789609 [Tanacetum coccineum]
MEGHVIAHLEGVTYLRGHIVERIVRDFVYSMTLAGETGLYLYYLCVCIMRCDCGLGFDGALLCNTYFVICTGRSVGQRHTRMAGALGVVKLDRCCLTLKGISRACLVVSADCFIALVLGCDKVYVDLMWMSQGGDGKSSMSWIDWYTLGVALCSMRRISVYWEVYVREVESGNMRGGRQDHHRSGLGRLLVSGILLGQQVSLRIITSDTLDEGSSTFEFYWWQLSYDEMRQSRHSEEKLLCGIIRRGVGSEEASVMLFCTDSEGCWVELDPRDMRGQ